MSDAAQTAPSTMICKTCECEQSIDNFYLLQRLTKTYRVKECKECQRIRARNNQRSLKINAAKLKAESAKAKPIKKEQVIAPFRICEECKVEKDVRSFSFLPHHMREGDIYKKVCKECIKRKDEAKKVRASQQREMQRREKEATLMQLSYYERVAVVLREKLEKHIHVTYRLTLEQYDEMMKTQKGCCAICQERTNLFVDHDHETGTVRGLICLSCNTALGHFKDNPVYLENAIHYLAKSRWEEC